MCVRECAYFHFVVVLLANNPGKTGTGVCKYCMFVCVFSNVAVSDLVSLSVHLIPKIKECEESKIYVLQNPCCSFHETNNKRI